MPDVPARIECYGCTECDRIEPTRCSKCVDWEHLEPGLWFPVAPEAVAEIRETLEYAVSERIRKTEPFGTTPMVVDAVLRALGFTNA